MCHTFAQSKTTNSVKVNKLSTKKNLIKQHFD